MRVCEVYICLHLDCHVMNACIWIYAAGSDPVTCHSSVGWLAVWLEKCFSRTEREHIYAATGAVTGIYVGCASVEQHSRVRCGCGRCCGIRMIIYIYIHIYFRIVRATTNYTTVCEV